MHDGPHAQINVSRAVVEWLPGTEATRQGANRILNVGCESSYSVRASGGDYAVEIQPVGPQGTDESSTQVQAQKGFPREGIRLVTVAKETNLHDAQVVWRPEHGSEGSVTRVCVVAKPKGWGADASSSHLSGTV
jgi:hypothetical protein